MSGPILVVDDSPSVRRMIAMTLKGAGFTVIEAGDGQEGLEKLAQGRPAAVITDQNMPRLDGLSFVRALRARPGMAGVPVVFLSTDGDPALKERARAAGAIGWMLKPFDPPKLLDVMRRIAG